VNWTNEQLVEVMRIILPKKAEEQRHLLKQLDTTALMSLFKWATQYQDKHPDFYRETFAVLAIKDLFTMCDAVLGFNRTNYGSDMNLDLHGSICAKLDNRPSRRLGWLIAREHMKTQIITTADAIRRIADDPNPRGVIVSGTRDNAVKMLGAIKNYWDTNPLLQWLYPYRLPDKRKHTWNEDALVFNGRTIIYREPCIEARGAESELTSAHWDWAKFDDLVGRENSQTDDQLAKTINWWRIAQPLLTPKCEVDIPGTRYADGDLYGFLIDNNSPIDWMVVPATKIDAETQEEAPVWPEYHTMESLEQKKIDMGPYDYSCQMECDPIPKGSEEFQQHYFYLYEDDELDPNEIKHRGTVCDPAYTKKVKAAGNPDFSVVITGGFRKQGNLVVFDIDTGQVGTEKTVGWMHKHQRIWGSKVGVETQSALEDYMNLHNQKNPRQYIRFTKLRSGNIDKDSRIATLIPLAGKTPIWLPKKNPHSQTMINQFLRWPRSKKRDLMDALAYLPQFVRAVRKGRDGEDVRFKMEYEPDNAVTGY
jgi:phage terminase large subunit-like protein